VSATAVNPGRDRVLALARHARHSSLHRNSAWIMLTIVVTSCLGYAYWVAVARIFPAHQVGLATGLVSLMTVTAITASFGTAPVLVQRLPRCDSVESWSTTLSASLVGGAVLGAVAGAVVLGALPLLSHQLAAARHDPLLAVLFVAGTIACIASMILDYAFIAERSSRSMSSRGAIFALVKIPLVLVPALVFNVTDGTTVIFASWFAAYAISCLLALTVLLPSVRPGFRLRVRGVGRELRGAAHMLAGNHLITLGNALPLYLLPVIVVTRLSSTANAYFYITWMVGGIFFMISSSIGSSLFAEGSNDPTAIATAARSSARLTALLLLPAMLLVFVAGGWILGLFGPAYAAHGTHLLWILALAAIPDAITNLYVPVLRVRQRLRSAALLTMSMAAATIAAAWLVAPSLKLVGIGVVWLLGQAIGSAWVAWDIFAVRRRSAREEAACHS